MMIASAVVAKSGFSLLSLVAAVCGGAIALPLLQISDIQIRIAELQRERAKLADEVRDKVAKALVDFDEARISFQSSQVLATRSLQQFQVYEIRYVRGNSDTESYLARENSLDNTKAQTYEAWAKMRRSLFQVKLLVLNVQEAEN